MGSSAKTAPILTDMRQNQKSKLNHETVGTSGTSDASAMAHLLAELSEREACLTKQGEVFVSVNGSSLAVPQENQSSSASVPITPVTESFGTAAASKLPGSTTTNNGQSGQDEVLRLKLELAQVRNELHRVKESGQDRQISSDLGVSPPPLGHEYPLPMSAGSEGAARLGHLGGPGSGGYPSLGRETSNGWGFSDDSRSDISEAYSANGFNRARSIWGNGNRLSQPTFPTGFASPDMSQHQPGPWIGRGGSQDQAYMDSQMNMFGSSGDGYRHNRGGPDGDMTIRAPSNRRSGRFDGRFGPPSGSSQGPYGAAYNGYGQAQFDGSMSTSGNQYPMGLGTGSSGSTQLSPLATEFTSASASGPWRAEVRYPCYRTHIRGFLLTSLRR